MGLDMYLNVRHSQFVGDYYDESNGKLKHTLPKELEIFKDTYRNACTFSAEYEIGYWRKANQIHKWFVDNCGNGIDECQDIYVRYNDLVELLNTVQKVLDNHELAKDLLPTCSGCFFGSEEYDEYYFKDLEDTKNIIATCIKFLDERKKADDNSWRVIYNASW